MFRNSIERTRKDRDLFGCVCAAWLAQASVLMSVGNTFVQVGEFWRGKLQPHKLSRQSEFGSTDNWSVHSDGGVPQCLSILSLLLTPTQVPQHPNSHLRTPPPTFRAIPECAGCVQVDPAKSVDGASMHIHHGCACGLSTARSCLWVPLLRIPILHSHDACVMNPLPEAPYIGAMSE